MIDPNEAPEGYLMAVKPNHFSNCTGCYYEEKDVPGCNEWCGYADDRKDGCLVIFVKKPDDGRATANFPCDDMGTPV